MKTCSGSSSNGVIHEEIVYNSPNCPLCKLIERNHYLTKRTGRDPNASFDECSKELVSELRKELTSIELLISKYPHINDDLRILRSSLVNHIDFIREVSSDRDKMIEIEIIGGSKYIIFPEKINDVRRILIGNRIKFTEKFVNDGFKEIKNDLKIKS